MFKLAKNLVCFALATLMAFALAGCDSSDPATYAVKAYSGGQVVRSFEATSYGTGEGRVYANQSNGRKHAVGGSFSVRRTDPGADKGSANATKYVAELYSGGKVVESVNAYSYSGGDGKITLSVSNSGPVVFGGTYVVRNIGVNLEGVSDRAKYKVTVYSDGVVVGIFNADSYGTGDDKLYLTIYGISNAVVVAGEYVVEQFR